MLSNAWQHPVVEIDSCQLLVITSLSFPVHFPSSSFLISSSNPLLHHLPSSLWFLLPFPYFSSSPLLLFSPLPLPLLPLICPSLPPSLPLSHILPLLGVLPCCRYSPGWGRPVLWGQRPSWLALVSFMASFPYHPQIFGLGMRTNYMKSASSCSIFQSVVTSAYFITWFMCTCHSLAKEHPWA